MSSLLLYFAAVLVQPSPYSVILFVMNHYYLSSFMSKYLTNKVYYKSAGQLCQQRIRIVSRFPEKLLI